MGAFYRGAPAPGAPVVPTPLSAKESVMYHALCFLSNGVEVVDGVTIGPEKVCLLCSQL